MGTITIKRAFRWTDRTLRTCRSPSKHCVLCRQDITRGEQYRDGGYGKRAHESCAQDWMAEHAAQLGQADGFMREVVSAARDNAKEKLMPIRESQRNLYPADWKDISRRVREEAGQRCECMGECGSAHEGTRCSAPNGEHVCRNVADPSRWGFVFDLANREESVSAWRDPILIVLTVAHMDHDASNNERSNLRALCQYCHLRLDREQHTKNAAATRRGRKAAGELF